MSSQDHEDHVIQVVDTSIHLMIYLSECSASKDSSLTDLSKAIEQVLVMSLHGVYIYWLISFKATTGDQNTNFHT